MVFQCLVRDNLLLQKYVTERYARVWRLSTPINNPPSINGGDDMKDGLNKSSAVVAVVGEEDDEEETKSNGDVAQVGVSGVLIKQYALIKDLIILHGTDTFGATVALGQLLRSNENIIQRLVNKELMLRFKRLGDI